MNWTPWIPALLLAGVAAPAWAVDGLMLKDDSLRASPSAGAAVVARVAKGGKVDILARQGGWTEVRAAGKTGWVRLLSVRASAAEGGSAADLEGVVGLARKQSDPGRVVAVAGLRGLNEEELRAAQYDAQEMRRLEAQAVSAAQARAFAAEAGLAQRSLPYLPGPKRDEPAGAAPWGGQ